LVIQELPGNREIKVRGSERLWRALRIRENPT
jgi:hypothetical protein